MSLNYFYFHKLYAKLVLKLHQHKLHNFLDKHLNQIWFLYLYSLHTYNFHLAGKRLNQKKYFQYGLQTDYHRLELVLSHTKKSCIVSFYRQFSSNKINTNLFCSGLWLLEVNYTGINLILFILLSTYPRKAVYNTMQ